MGNIERTPERMAVCQHPHGEGVWWDVNARPHPGCIQDCDCTPVEYVRADLHRGAVEALDFITGGKDHPVWTPIYQAAGGGYEGLQAVARAALGGSR